MTDCKPSLPAWAEGKIAVDPDSGCWLWTGVVLNTGYGQVRLPCPCGEGIKIQPAHRAMYEALVGPIAPGLHADHLCRVPRCVNPQHLEPVTPAENNRRGMSLSAQNARKTHCPKGHPYDEANTSIGADGARNCLACKRVRSAAARERARQGRPRQRARSADRAAAIAELYTTGLSQVEVARELGITSSYVCRVMREHGIPRRPGRGVRPDPTPEVAR